MGDEATMPVVTPWDDFRRAMGGDEPRAVLDHWNERRRESAMPAPKDIDPLGIGAGPLPHLFILDIEEDDRYRFRLTGTLLPTVFGSDVGGRYLDELLKGDELANARRSYKLIQSTCRAWHSRAIYRLDGDGTVTWERLAVPLGEDGKVTRILGGLFIETETDTFEDYGELYGRGGLVLINREERLLA